MPVEEASNREGKRTQWKRKPFLGDGSITGVARLFVKGGRPVRPDTGTNGIWGGDGIEKKRGR